MTRFAFVVLTLFAVVLAVGARLFPRVSHDDTSVAAASIGAAWTDDATAALAKAKSENKVVLLDFTGSDWCIWCKRLDAEVFSKGEFTTYAEKNLVLVKVDFPRALKQTSAVRRQNQGLADKYKIEGYPTIVLLNSTGEKIGQLGYIEGGTKAWLAEMRKITGI